MTVEELIARRGHWGKTPIMFAQTDYVSLTPEENDMFHKVFASLEWEKLCGVYAMVQTEMINRTSKKEYEHVLASKKETHGGLVIEAKRGN